MHSTFHMFHNCDPLHLRQSILRSITNGTSILRQNEQPLNNQKLESSLLTFAINNPKWLSNIYQSVVLQVIARKEIK